MLRQLLAFGAAASVIAEHNYAYRGGRLLDSTGQEIVFAPAGRAHRIAELAKRQADTVQQQNSSIVFVPSRARCVEHKGERLCQQQVEKASCPLEYFRSALNSCYWLARYLNEQDEADTEVRVIWWTSYDCMVHRTLCEVSHPKHEEQYEDETYDFKESCAETAHVQLHRSYNLVGIVKEGETRQHYIHVTATLEHGESQRVFVVNDEGRPLQEEFMSVKLYERDSTGRVTYSDQGIDMSAISPATGDVEGLHAQVENKIVNYAYQSGVPGQRAYLHRNSYHITKKRLLANCPADKRDQWVNTLKLVFSQVHNHEAHDPGLLIGVIAGVVVFVAALSAGLHCYLNRRREYYAKQAELHAQTIQVAQSAPQSQPQPHNAMYPTQDFVVEGTLVDQDYECTPAPLPPAAGEQS